MGNFLAKYRFLIISGSLMILLIVLFKFAWMGRLLDASLSEINTRPVDLAWQMNLRSENTVILPKELLIVEVNVSNKAPVAKGNLQINFPGNLLNLVRVSGKDSVMNTENVAMRIKTNKTQYHGVGIEFENTSFNGALVGGGKLMTLYFVGKNVGDGAVEIDYADCSISDIHEKTGSIYGETKVDFRIE